MATFLELVNKTIRSAGVELDELLVGDFASPSDPLQAKFKEWVGTTVPKGLGVHSKARPD
jgi:hypothetical protein